MSARDGPRQRGSRRTAILAICFVLAGCCALLGCAAMNNTLNKMQGQAEPLAPFMTGSPESTGLLVVDCDAWYDLEKRVDISGSFFSDLIEEGIDDAQYPDGRRMWMRHARLAAEDDSIHGGKRTRENAHPVVLFSNLAPGIYTLVQVRATHDASTEEVIQYYSCSQRSGDEGYVFFDKCPTRFDFTYDLSPETRESLTVEIEAGEVHYLGKLLMTETETPPYTDVRDINVTTWNRFRGFHVVGATIDSAHRTNHRAVRVPATVEDEIEAWNQVLETLEGPWGGTEDRSWVPVMQARVSLLRGDQADAR